MFAILFTESRLSKIKEDIQLKYTRQFSLITIVNKEPVYQEFKKNLDTQVNVDYELIKIDNYDNQFNSARAAYNDAAKKANGEYLAAYERNAAGENDFYFLCACERKLCEAFLPSETFGWAGFLTVRSGRFCSLAL